MEKIERKDNRNRKIFGKWYNANETYKESKKIVDKIKRDFYALKFGFGCGFRKGYAEYIVKTIIWSDIYEE